MIPDIRSTQRVSLLSVVVVLLLLVVVVVLLSLLLLLLVCKMSFSCLLSLERFI